MKKITLLSFAFVLMASSSLFAQSKNVIKLNLFSVVASTINLSYERALNEKTSFQLGGAYTTAKSGSVKYSGFQVQPEVRFYLSESKEAPAGFYIAPFGRYRSLKAESSIDKATWTSVGGGLVIGGQWLFANDHVAFGIFGGPAYYSHSIKYDNPNAEFDLKGAGGGFAVRSGVTLGVAF